MYADEDSIFFAYADSGRGLYRYDLALHKVTLLAEGNISMINLDTGRVFYKITEEETGLASVMSIKKDGSEPRISVQEEDNAGVNTFEVYGENIYYIAGSAGLYRMPKDGGTKGLLVSGGAISGFNIYDERIYYLTVAKEEDVTGKEAWSETVSSCNVDGSDEKQIAGGLLPGSPIGIIGGKIYCFDRAEPSEDAAPSEHRQIYRMDTYGKEKESF
jgi:hypothetical protein